MIKVFGFTHGNNGVSMYRTWQPLDNLNKADFKVKRVPNRSEKIHWPNMTDEPNVPGLGSYAEIIEKNDIIFSNFKSADADCAMLCIAAKLKKVVVDIDDDILHMPTDNNNYKHWFNPENGTDYWAEIEPDDMENCQKWEKEGRGLILTNPQTKKLCFVVVRKHPWENVIQELKAAHLVTVSTQKMKEVYGQYNKNTVVIPNAIDFSNYPMLVKPKKDNLVRIGLFGSNSHYRDWKTVAGVIKTILEEYPNVRFVCNPWFRANSASDDAELTLIYPDYFDKLREHPQCEWFAGVEIDHYHEWLADKQVDIGIAPLCDSEFNKCKSNIKYLEFSALRIPGVYADLEPYNADVNGGHNGFLASNSSDWLKCLRQLIQSPALRIRMGNLAFQDVKSRYDIKDVVKKLELELHKLMVNVGGLSGS